VPRRRCSLPVGIRYPNIYRDRSSYRSMEHVATNQRPTQSSLKKGRVAAELWSLNDCANHPLLTIECDQWLCDSLFLHFYYKTRNSGLDVCADPASSTIFAVFLNLPLRRVLRWRRVFFDFSTSVVFGKYFLTKSS
jgi:hypothetical protein